MEVRGRAGAGESRFHDLHFRDFMADPLAAIEKLYAHVGWPFSEVARARMSAYLEVHPADEHGGHVYSLEGAGLDLGIERERFSAYVKRYAVESEA